MSVFDPDRFAMIYCPQKQGGTMRRFQISALSILGITSVVWAQEDSKPVYSIDELLKFQKAITERLAHEGREAAQLGERLNRDFARDLGCPSGACEPLTKEMILRYLVDTVLPAITGDDSSKTVNSSLTIKTGKDGARVRWMLASTRDRGKSRSELYLSSRENESRLAKLKQGRSAELGFDLNAAAHSKKVTALTEDVPIGLYYIWTERKGRITSNPFILYSIVARKEELVVDEWTN